MKPKSDHDPLLSAVLFDPEWDGRLLGDLLQGARRRRRRRRMRRVAGGAALLALLGWSALSSTRLRSFRGQAASALETMHSTLIVTSVPFRPVVTTLPFRPSTPLASARYQEIGDRELLALAQGRGAILVEDAPGRERLVFP